MPLPILLIFSALLAGADVTERDGNIFLKQDSGSLRQLTRNGMDYDPALSCDEKSLVFVRRGPLPNRSSIDEEIGNRDGNELWIALLSAPGTPRKVFSGDQKQPPWFGLVNPRFSADGQRLYFLLWFGNGYSLYELAIQTGEAKLIVGSARAFWIVCKDPYKNDVVVQEDHLKLGAGHVDLFWLYDSQGRRGSLVGTDRNDVATFFGIRPDLLK